MPFQTRLIKHIIISDLYDISFPKKEIELKSKYLNTPWITKGLQNLTNVNISFMKNYSRKLKNLLRLTCEIYGK